MHNKTIAELAVDLRARRISSVELTRLFVERIGRLDGRLNSFITVMEAQALSDARSADQRLAAGRETGGEGLHPLTGVPIALKDLFCTDGVRTSCGSRMLDNFIAPYDAAVVERLRRAGAVLIGKTNMDEFAMGSSGENSWYGATRNPWDVERAPGGSSSGSAAAVAARLVPGALGTDTGGSIRQPASLCGLTGIKPTYGRVSRWGMVAFASSLDQAGPLARSAEDCALLLDAVAGFDVRDSTSVERPAHAYAADLDAPFDIRRDGLRIGVPRQYFDAGLDEAVGAAVHEALDRYRRMGAKLVDIDLRSADLAIPAYYVLAPAEASSNLARYDGVHFGYRCAEPANLDDLYQRSRGEGFGAEAQRRILIGTYVLSAGYYDAYYLKAQRIRRLIAEDFARAFAQADVLMGPVSPSAAFRLGEKVDDPVQMYLSDIYTLAPNLAGLPALSMPVGFTPQGLPVGLHLIGDHWQEGRLLKIAHRYQQQTDWHRRVPNGF